MAAERIAILACTVAALAAGGAHASAPQGDPPVVAGKPSRVVVKEAGTHVWHDGATKRRLTLVPSVEADFSPGAARGAAVIRPSGATAPSAAAAFRSPVLRDEGGRLRALPGGVLVVLRAPLNETAARALIGRAGATPAQRLSDTLWRIEGPVGLGSLELAERLHASGLFASAQPDWWVERTLK
jgi:hypothetical protein